MSTSDWIQSISLLLVAVALFLTFIQLRHSAKQGLASAEVLRQTSYEAFQTGDQGGGLPFLREDVEMLTWHLQMRGYPASDADTNKRTFVLLLRLENHERNAINYDRGRLDREVWQTWQNVMRSDFKQPEFHALWPAAKQYFAPTLGKMVDSMLLELASTMPEDGSSDTG